MQALFLKGTRWSLGANLTTLALFHPGWARGSFSQGLIPLPGTACPLLPLEPQPELLSGAYRMPGPPAWNPTQSSTPWRIHFTLKAGGP